MLRASVLELISSMKFLLFVKSGWSFLHAELSLQEVAKWVKALQLELEGSWFKPF